MFLESKTFDGGTRRGRRVVSRVVGDEAVVIPLHAGGDRRNSVYTFNESGTLLWAMIEAGRSTAELADCLQSEYGLSSEQAMADTQQFVADLTEEGLIEPA
jgi:hypothetical protein